MPELPWIPWYPMAWASEPGLKACELSTRAIWIEIINTMFLTETGRISGTIEHLCWKLSVHRQSQMQLAVEELQKFDIAPITIEQNGNIIIECRRCLRYFNTKLERRKAGIASGLKRRTKHEQTYPSPSPSPSSEGVQGEQKFKEPTLEEVKLLFAKAGGSEEQASAFWFFYDKKGWMVGKTKMKRLGSAVAGWVHENRQLQPKNPNPQGYLKYEPRQQSPNPGT